MQFSFTNNIPDALRYLTEVEKSVLPLAHAKALTFTAEAVRDAETTEMQTVFDRPTPYTLNSLAMRPASVGSQTAEVFFKEGFGKGTPASNFLQPHVRGGGRAQKRSERALAARGLMGNKGYWVPAKGVKLNQYGNLTGALWSKILSDLQVTSDAHQWRNKAKRKSRYFVPRPGSKLTPGVYERMANGRIRAIVIFVSSVNYKKRFDFYGIARRVAEIVFPQKWESSFKRELARVTAPK